MGPQKMIYDPVLHMNVFILVPMVTQLQGVNKQNQDIADLRGNGALGPACQHSSRMRQSTVGARLSRKVAAFGGSSGQPQSVPVNLPSTASPDMATSRPPLLFDHDHTYTHGCYFSVTYVLE